MILAEVSHKSDKVSIIREIYQELEVIKLHEPVASAGVTRCAQRSMFPGNVRTRESRPCK
jgi:hypothetical protein